MSSRREFLKDTIGTTAGIFFVGCGLMRKTARSQQSVSKAKRRQAIVAGRHALTVDVHCHCFIPEVWDLIKDHKEAQSVHGFLEGPDAPILQPIHVDLRLKEMDDWGIDIQAVSHAPAYNYWAEPDLARKIVQLENEKLAELCATHPDRFVGLGRVALQHPELALQQMAEGMKKLGFRGFEIGGNVNGEELSSPRFHPIWAKAEELGAVLFMHPAGFQYKRFEGKGRLGNIIGNPLETTVALSHLIFEETLDRFPRLKICAAHGGGFLPSYIGRSDRCFNAPQSCKTGPKRPSDYLKQIYFDSLVFTNEGMRHLIAEVGYTQVVIGTDFPFHWEEDPVGYILGVPGLSADQRRAILGGNAAKLLRINA